MSETLLFDVNETLLDLQPLRPHFERLFDDGRVMAEWFGLMLRHSLVATVTRRYRPFDELGRDALAMVGKKYGSELETRVVEDVVGEMSRLPPHPDVIPALTRLRDAGVRMATLTNSAPPVQSAQLEHAGLTDFFERQFSVEAVGLFKPAAEPYRYAAQQLGEPIENVRLVAAHDWDVTGAIRAGAKGAFVARKGMVLGGTGEIPDIIGPHLLDIAGSILNHSP